MYEYCIAEKSSCQMIEKSSCRLDPMWSGGLKRYRLLSRHNL